MREEFICAGFGGQGIMLMGKLLAHAAMNEGKFVTWMPSYGAEVRGGTAHSMVIISDEVIPSPLVTEPNICIVMNRPSLQKFEKRVRKKGLLLLNKSLIEVDAVRKDIGVLNIPATDIAVELGNTKIANMIMVGALIAKRAILPLKALIGALKDVMPESHKDMVPLNEKALKKGYEYGSC